MPASADDANGTLRPVDAQTARLSLLDSAAQAAGLGTFQWNLTTGELTWDATLLEVFGYDESTFGGTIESFDARLHPGDVGPVSAALESAVATCGVYEAEFRVLRPDGTVRWLTARGRALAGPSGQAAHLIGVTTDTTALRERDLRVRQILEDMSTAYYWVDAGWRFGYVNAEAERLLARTREDLLGVVIWDLFPGAVGTAFEERYRAAARTGEPQVFDAYYPAPLDGWYEVRAIPERGGVAAYFTEITERRRALDLAEQERARSDLRARVADELADAVDPVRALESVLAHLVPDVADFAIASILDEGTGSWRARLRDVAARHSEADLQPVLDEYRSLRVPALARTSLVAEVLATSRPAVRYGSPPLHDIVQDGPARDLLERLAPETLMVLPLRGRGRTRGLITLDRSAARGEFTDAEVTALRDVTAQIGLALDNAHLNSAQRDLAEELQRSLLTELPEPDHLHLVARYVPASTGTQIGGDWYDAFLLRDGCTCLVIGDVTGHDLHAAVKMAQIRNVLRGGAHAVAQPPAAILSAFDWAAHDLAIGAFSTAILARIEQPDELGARGMRLLRWSNAGHPPPLLVHPDGRAELLRRPSDLLLGLRKHTVRQDHTQLIAPGATVLLYTDGLVERRGERLEVGLERLRRCAERLHHLPLEEFCDAVVEELARTSEDDVALLAVRAFPEDEPRPAEAGPEQVPGDHAPSAS
ncbi:SpoIIE family protein phosphatase [Cellulomonas sp. S1-8]|uniref:SpoIIE family protein phosphatase n=1 Tax=Cellulomonas sp. S1-8 TaxID=2904790 RepID=UPI0022430937|nr:SpoIIE family protein phosphatase [Cellulomonas sp. S1-8]UZN02956.1 SpoIIE family protein phosphatase [Cellulomonas sp. S1-8]